MGLTVIHAGQDISPYVIELNEGQLSDHGPGGTDALQIESVLAQGAGVGFGGSGHQTTCTFSVWLGPAATAIGANKTPSGTDLVRQGEVQVFDATGTAIFGGHVTALDDATQSLSPKTQLTCTDYWASLDRIQVFELYTGRSDTFIIKDLLTKYAPWVDQTLLPTTDQYVWSKFPAKGGLREVIQKVVDTVGWHVWIDPTKHMHYVSPTSASTAPFALSDDADSISTQGYNLTKYTVDDNSIINRVYFYGGKNTSADFDQDLSTQSNGSIKTFALLYFPHPAADGNIHVIKNGVELVVGSPFDSSAAGKLKSAGGTSDVLLNRDSMVLTFDVAPAKTDTLICRYRYQTPLVVVLASTTSNNFFGAWYDGRIVDQNTFDSNTAMQRCRVLLAQQSFGLTSMALTTWAGGLQAGQLVRVTNGIRAIDSTYLIQKVITKPLGGGVFEYDLELGAWNWNLIDMMVQGARILNPTDGYSEEDLTIIQAKEHASTASVTTAYTKTTHATGQYYSGQSIHSGFFTANAATGNGPLALSFKCIDTMKESMDREATSLLTQTQINQAVNLIATLNVTHISVDTAYDYPSVMSQWVQAIRAAGKKVWFRCHWNAWQGDNGVAASLTPTTYISQTQTFVTTNSTFFQSGDIFDACPESENSPYWQTTYGNNWSWTGAPSVATDAFNNFDLNLASGVQTSLTNAGVTGVITGIRSHNSWWAQNPNSLYTATLNTLGYLTIDSYPEASNTDPATCASARITELQAIIKARPGIALVIGEMGYSNSVNVDDTNQQQVLAAELSALANQTAIVGLNYWVGQGGAGSGGYTNILTGTHGAWTTRPAATTLATFFGQH